MELYKIGLWILPVVVVIGWVLYVRSKKREFNELKNEAEKLGLTIREVDPNVEAPQVENPETESSDAEESTHPAIIKVKITGDQALDNVKAFHQFGVRDMKEMNEILGEYTWHYLDDLDPDLNCTMQLVQTEALKAAGEFSDSRDIFEQLIGIKYKRMKLGDKLEA